MWHVMSLGCAFRRVATENCTSIHHDKETNNSVEQNQETLPGHTLPSHGRSKKSELRAVLKDTPTPREADSTADSRLICETERAERRCSHGKARSVADGRQPEHASTRRPARDVAWSQALVSHLVLWIPWFGSFLS